MKFKLFLIAALVLIATGISLLLYFSNHKESNDNFKSNESIKTVRNNKKHINRKIKKLTPEEIKKLLNQKGIDEEDRIAVLTELSDVNTPEALGILDSCLDDPSLDVRLEALSIISEFDSDIVIPTIEKAMKDKNEEVRIAAIRAISFSSLDSPDLVIKSIDDPSENVREIGLELAGEVSSDIKYDICEYGIHSDYIPVKEEAVNILSNIHSKKSIDILIRALKIKDPSITEDVVLALDYLLGEEFSDYNQAKQWWGKNKHLYNDELELVDE